MVKPWAKAIAAIPGRPTPSPTTAAAPAPMNTKAKVPMNSARSLGAILVDIVYLQREVRSCRSGGTTGLRLEPPGRPDDNGTSFRCDRRGPIKDRESHAGREAFAVFR